MYPLIIPFRSSAVTGFQETEIFLEDAAVAATASGDVLGSKSRIMMS